MKFADNEETPPVMSEEGIEAHSMVVVLVDNFNMKKGIDIFGNRAETPVMKELQKIHDMNTYEPMDASMLTYQDRKYDLDSLLFIAKRRG